MDRYVKKSEHSATKDLKIALQHAASLMRKDPHLAEQQALEILKAYPDELSAVNLLAGARRRNGKHESALRLLQKVVSRRPSFAPAQQELGLTLLALGRFHESESALKRALELDPDMATAWKARGDLLAARGDEPGSQEAYSKYVILTAKHPELVKAAKFLFTGKLAKAEHLLREFLKQHPTNVSAIRMLADTGMKLGRYNDAQILLERCLELASDFHLARNNYANVLFKKFKYEPALTQIEKVLVAEPNNPSHLLLKASILAGIGETDGAIEIFERILTDYPRQARTQLSYGHALKTAGRQDEAIEAYRAANRLRPGLGEAYWSLANLKTFRFDDNDLETMKKQVAADHDDAEDYYHLYFALGKANEDRGEYDTAFENYRQGNTIRRKTVRWDADEHHRNINKLIEFFDKRFFETRKGQGCAAKDPIFIVGLPRSGSTLLEQILASHSQVEGTWELPDIISIARRLSGKKMAAQDSRYPEILAELSPDKLAELGEEYLTRTRIHRGGTPFFIDKMPNNFSHVGLIHLVLPNAKIIDARRHPLACCFSAYKQLFASGQNFSYTLEELGCYYRDYAELMTHWENVLPRRVLRVQYEDVVADVETQVARLLDYCGLPFEQSCVEFYRTERAVRTASSEQVRQPIYSGAIEQWRYFGHHLDPLIAAIGPELVNKPDAPAV